MCAGSLRSILPAGGAASISSSICAGRNFASAAGKSCCEFPMVRRARMQRCARAVGNPTGFRAVGQANHFNPIAIIVPCHRVLASDHKLGGYGGGLNVKALLLKLEGASFRDAQP